MLNILAVDDEPALLSAMKRVLERAGHKVVCATTGDAAVSAFGGQGFDVAVVDYHIPEPDGLEVLKRLREVHPACVRVLASGRLDLPVVVEAVNDGEVSWVLGKPFMPQELLDAIGQAVNHRERAVQVQLDRRQRAETEQRELFHECLAGDSIRLALQPIVRAQENGVYAYEALLRSTHPLFKGPLDLLSAAERFNMVADLSDVVVQRAAAWFSDLPAEAKLFMNLHPDELQDPEGLRQRLEKLSPWAERMVVEITERSRVFDNDHWQDSIDHLQDLGFALAVDDLGAGYSSLSTLAALQPRYIKVDMSIIRDVDTDVRKQRLVELLCRFSSATEALMVAEGVETQSEAETLRALGTDLLQGYHFGRPSLKLQLAAA